MFVDLPAPIDHQDPWFLSGETRLLKLMRTDLRIAYVYERPDNSTFRYRIHNMVEVIEATWPEASAAYFFIDDGSALLDKVADMADVVVICRARYSQGVNRLVRRAKRRGIPVVFDVDDLVFNTRYAPLLMDSLAQKGTTEQEWDFWFAYVGRIGATLQLCDRAITTNPFLAARITEFAGVETSVVPNFINKAQLDYSRAVWKAKQESGFARDRHIHIGYFSGSPTHIKDFALVESALVKLLKRFSQLRIRMVGYLEPAGPLLDHLDRIDREPFHDYVNLQRLIGSTEINIAPLQDNRFTNCKSELKYFEAAIVGTSTIATPTSTFAAAIRHGDNARLAAAHQWEEVMAEVVEEIEAAPDCYSAMAERAVADADARYGWHRQGDAIRAAVMR
jgi:glycosyltransferase involved in cell wall biosynthesis